MPLQTNRATSDVREIHSSIIGKTLVCLVILAPAVLDWLHGLLATEYGLEILSSLYRMLLIGLAGFLFIRHPRRYPFVLVYILLAFFLVELLFWTINSSQVSPSGELNIALNYVLLLACFLIIEISMREFHVTRDYLFSAIVNYGKITATIIILSLLFDIGVPTYSSADGVTTYGFGTQSYYIAGNVLGLTLVASLTVSLHRFMMSKNFKTLSESLLILLGAFSIGSRTGMFVSTLMFIGWIIYFAVFISGHRAFRLFVISFVGIISLYGGVKTYEIVSSYPRLLQKFELMLEGSIRESHTAAATRYIEGRPLLNYIFGEGYVSYTSQFATFHKKKGEEKITTENDVMDVLAAYGVLGLIFFYSPFVLAMFLSGRNYFRRHQALSLTTFFTLGLIIGHSMLAGHVLFSTKSLQFAAVFLVLGIFSSGERSGYSNLSDESSLRTP